MKSLSAPIGRAAETATLERTLSEARSGNKRAVVIRGAPGMGKTTLLYWAHGIARDSGFSTAIARAPAVGGLPPRFPLAELLGDLASGLAGAGAEIPELVIETLDALKGTGSKNVRPPNLLQFARALEEVAGGRPVAVMLDDLQWAPREHLLLLVAALRLAEVPLLFVATERTETPAKTSESFPLEAAADLPVDLLNLEGLTLDSVGELAWRTVGAPLLPSLCRAVHARTLGNPLFALETLRAWRESGQISVIAGGYWGFVESPAADESRSLLEVIGTRLRSMPPHALSVARALAILGRAGSFDELKLIVTLSSDELTDALGTLEDQGIVTPETTGTQRLAHPLFQSSLMSTMGRSREAAWHGRVYTALKEAASRPSASELAYHANRALEPPADLVPTLRAAVAEARRTGSYAEAADWYGRLARNAVDRKDLIDALTGRASALEHFDAAGAASVYGEAIAVTTDGPDRAKLLLGRARSFRMAGDFDRSLDDLLNASRLASPADELQIRHAIAAVSAARGDIEDAVRLFGELIEDSQGTDVHAMAMGHSATLAILQGRLHESKTLSHQALDECSDAQYAAYLETNLCFILLVLGEWDAAETLLDACIERASRAHDIWFLPALLSTASMLYAWEGATERALDNGTESVRVAKHGNVVDQITALGGLGNALLERGEFEEITSLLGQVPMLVGIAPEKHETFNALSVLAEAHLLLGGTAAAEETLGLAVSYVKQNVLWEISIERLRAQLDLANGETASAIARTEQYIAKPSAFAFEQARIMEVSAHALWANGQRDAARARASDALSAYQGLGAARRAQQLSRWIEERKLSRPGRPRRASPGTLTEREAEILVLIANGRTNREIARDLTISPGTVKKHVENMKSKLGVHRRTELATHRSRPSSTKW